MLWHFDRVFFSNTYLLWAHFQKKKKTMCHHGDNEAVMKNVYMMLWDKLRLD